MSEDKSPWQKYKDNIEEYKKNLGDTRPWDLINPNVEKSSEEEASRRFEICRSCPELTKRTEQCKKCGCFMAGKVRIKKSSCPIGKW